jgi:hypothetical protein
LFALVIGLFSSWPPYRHLAANQALIKLSFSHTGKPVSDCAAQSPEQLAKLPPNMRAPVRCHRVQVAAGAHRIAVRLTDDVRSAGFNHVREATVTLRPAQILVIDFDTSTQEITLK